MVPGGVADREHEGKRDKADAVIGKFRYNNDTC